MSYIAGMLYAFIHYLRAFILRNKTNFAVTVLKWWVMRTVLFACLPKILTTLVVVLLTSIISRAVVSGQRYFLREQSAEYFRSSEHAIWAFLMKRSDKYQRTKSLFPSCHKTRWCYFTVSYPSGPQVYDTNVIYNRLTSKLYFT